MQNAAFANALGRKPVWGQANKKFEGRFRQVESALTEQGLSPQAASLEQMESLWQQVKKTLAR